MAEWEVPTQPHAIPLAYFTKNTQQHRYHFQYHTRHAR